ncbi:DUF1365 domain-containing protein [Martelella endophytica]|uniref:DUF1365 domain-containing protein n=1 Tax=Martelella endophytica TaxID=1486262 RepID=A0A0D5LT86_MAREN|nr:DUF1365 domain-containing protein [Martelella endophytica]AJY46583.1 hypothetical protein TM49_14310 [Martelella endophytica]
MRSGIFRGEVIHQRHRPKKHRLSYRVFSLLIDLDELPALDRRLKLFAHNRFALFSLFDRDHGSLTGGDLKAWALGELESAGLEAVRVEMLCYPRILGYVFNPLTVFFCYGDDGRLVGILYEVCNTFKERFTYIIPVKDDIRPVRQSAEKQFYVSPFMPMDCVYHFAISPPEDAVSVRINETDPEGPLLYAGFAGKRQALTDRTLLHAFLRYPLMTLKIFAGIHFEALRLVLKGAPFFRHTPAAARVRSVVAGGRHAEDEAYERIEERTQA